MGGITRVGRGAILQILLLPFEGEFRVVFFQPIYKLYNLYVVLNKSSIICHDVAQATVMRQSFFLCHIVTDYWAYWSK